MEMVYKLSEAFHQDRRRELFKRLNDTDLDLLMIFDATTLAYLTGFFHMTTERPIGIGFTPDGGVFALTTELEIDQLRGKAPWLDDIDTYFDYPEGDWNWIADRLVDRGYAGILGGGWNGVLVVLASASGHWPPAGPGSLCGHGRLASLREASLCGAVSARRKAGLLGPRRQIPHSCGDQAEAKGQAALPIRRVPACCLLLVG